MSRSRRQSPFIGHTTAPSDKPWKQQNARALRRSVHQTLTSSLDGDAVPASRYAKGHCDWHGCKDGKQRLRDPASSLLRK